MSRSVHLTGFAVLLAAAVAFEVLARVTKRAPTLGNAVEAASRRRPLRAALLVGWLWLGWHLFARGDFG